MKQRDPIVWELVRLRRDQDLTQAEVALRMGVSTSYVSRLEGGYTSPTLATVYRWASAVGARLAVTQ